MIVDENTYVYGIWHGTNHDPLNLPHCSVTQVLYRHGRGPWMVQTTNRIVVDKQFTWDSSADRKWVSQTVLDSQTEAEAVQFCLDAVGRFEKTGITFDFLEVKGGPSVFVEKSESKSWLGRLSSRQPRLPKKQNRFSPN